MHAERPVPILPQPHGTFTIFFLDKRNQLRMFIETPNHFLRPNMATNYRGAELIKKSLHFQIVNYLIHQFF
jgi:hypothetical protein